MLAASSRKHIAHRAGLGAARRSARNSSVSCIAGAANAEWTTEMRPAHQNCQLFVITTHTPSAPLVTACAITAVQSLPLRT